MADYQLVLGEEDIIYFSEQELFPEQEFGDEETRYTNVAAAMEKAAEGAAVELEKIPSFSSTLEEIPLLSSKYKIKQLLSAVQV